MNKATKTVSVDALDEINTLQRCFSALADLMLPEQDLHPVNRENIAVLFGYLSARLAKATEEA